MDNHPAKAHLGTRLRVGMQRVIVTIQPVQQGRLRRSLVLKHGIGLAVLGRREVGGGRALGPAPVALADEEGGRGDARVDVARGGVDQVGLGVDDGARAALVEDAEYLCAELELLAG